MLCSSPDDALSVLRSGVLQMALAIYLPIAYQQSIRNVMPKYLDLFVSEVTSGQGRNILVFTIFLVFSNFLWIYMDG